MATVIIALLLLPLLLLVLPLLATITGTSSSQLDRLAFYYGVITTLIVVNFPRLLKIFGSSATERDRDTRLYGLEHGVLHLGVPLTTWWMNMGYWEEQKSPHNLSKACHALLRKVLSHAGLIVSEHSASISDSPERLVENLRILDVGFGCGDQTLAISKMSTATSYIGITLDKQQFKFAKARGIENVLHDKGAKIQLFQSDAARPDLWPADLKEAIQDQFHTALNQDGVTNGQKWLLALDTLYHFKPSRQPLFAYTHRELQASIMAFDLFLSDQPYSWIQHLFLRISCALGSTPYNNFLTKHQYQQLLSSVGYRKENIQIVDISQHVFTPLAEFLDHQDRQLKVLGFSIGKFRAARMLFNWWGRTGIVRGCVVVAKR